MLTGHESSSSGRSSAPHISKPAPGEPVPPITSLCRELDLSCCSRLGMGGLHGSLRGQAGSDGLVKLHAAYPNWSTHRTLDEMRENVPEYQLIQAGKKVGLLTNGQMKSLHGHLNTRNQAAHPTGFDPGINETLGFVESLLKLCDLINQKTL